MKIYEDFFDENAPCRNCENYDDGTVYENGSDFHEFECSGGHCLYCVELNGFGCFEEIETENDILNDYAWHREQAEIDADNQ